MDLTLLVLAAGMGSRYGGLKQIDPIGPNGEIILDYSIFDAMRAGFNKVVFVIRKDIEKDFRAVVSSRWENKINVEYAFQQLDNIPAPFTVPEGRVKPWGTGHAVLAAKDVIHEPFAALNADDFYGRSAYALLAKQLQADPADNAYCMVGYPLQKTLSPFGSVSRGVCEVKNGMLQDVVERTKITALPDGGARNDEGDGKILDFTGKELVSMNCWGFKTSLFTELEQRFVTFLKARGTELKSEIYLPFVVQELVQENKVSVRVLESVDSWFGITYREDKPEVQASLRKLISDGAYPEHIF